MGKKNVAEQLVEALKELGVRHVFGVPSGGWVDYMEALRAQEGIEFVLTTHEGGAAFMADVCGRLSGAPGVCFGTFGPGATNLATGVGSALLDRSPMLAFTDEMPEKLRGRTVQMAIDHQALFDPLTKHTTRLLPDRVRSTVFEAAACALAERPGPVHIGLPVGMSAEDSEPEAVSFAWPPAAGDLHHSKRSKIAEALETARKPIIALGLGAVRAGVGQRIAEFSRRQKIPIVLTPMAKGLISEDHPCYAGVLFHALSDQVAVTHRDADLVLAVGYDPVEFNFESWMPNAPLINIDTERVDIDQYQHEVLIDATGGISGTVDFLNDLPASPKDWDLAALAERRQRMFRDLSPPSSSFGPCATLDVLREVLPKDGIMTCDVGAHTHLIGQKWRTPGLGLQVMTNGWSAMGFGLPAAIAAKLCRPDSSVCAVLGDGGFLMTAGELAVAARLRLRIVFVVLTDNDLALIRIKQQRKHNPIYGTPVRHQGTIGGPSIFGVPVMTALSADDFHTRLTEAFQMDGPVIVEAVVDSREYDALVLKKDRA
jgi:acetolactate synthase-1/2/3 large subunit